MKSLIRRMYYWVTGKETKWNYVWDGNQYNWKKMRIAMKRGGKEMKLGTSIPSIPLIPTLAGYIVISGVTGPEGGVVSEDGDYIITEDGDYVVTEDSP